MQKFIIALASVIAIVALMFSFVAYERNPESPVLGAVSTLGISPLALNNILHYYQPIAFNTASSTLCAWKTTATTSLSSVGVTFTSAIGYSNTYELGIGNVITATTTGLVAAYTVPSGALASFMSTSTPSETLYPDNILPPNTWINLNVSTSSTGVNQVKGFCTITGRSLIASQ